MAPHTRHFKVGFFDDEIKIERVEVSVHSALFNFLVRGMQFTYDRVVFPEEMQKHLPNETLTGGIGALNRSEVDFLGTPFRVTERLNEAAYATFPFDAQETVFATRKTEYSPETTALFRTLSLNVWLSLLATTILFALVCYAWLKHRYTLEEIYFHVLAIGLNQEGHVVPRRAGGSLLLGTWMVGMALFTFCFKSVLLSFLTFPPLQGIRTVIELAAAIREGKYSAYRLSQIGYTGLLSSPNEDVRTIGESIFKSPIYNLEIFAENVEEYIGLFPNKALVHYREIMSYMGQMVYISEDNLDINFKAIPTKKVFCCKDEMNMLIHRFEAAGIKQKIYRFLKHIYTLNFSSSENLADDEKIRKITMTDLSGAFFLLIVGHCLSVCVLIIELRMKNTHKSHSSARKKRHKRHSSARKKDINVTLQ